MYSDADTWALVLAAGEGKRLQSLTTAASGAVVPKQFFSLRDSPSLLREALSRAAAVASTSQIVTVVAEQHRRWWEPQVGSLPAENVIVQPANRGTANGILLPLLHIIGRAPSAQIVVLVSDHHVAEEAIPASAMRQAPEQTQWRFDETVLLGLEPEESNPQLGYIVPGRSDSSDGRGALQVLQFIEKPTTIQARELIEHGGLWNSFILASSAQALLTLVQRRIPSIVSEMRAALQRDRSTSIQGTALPELYDELPTIDFSRDILQGQEAYLRVLPVPQCGWSDLGTPESVAQALRPERGAATEGDFRMASGYLNLAVQHERVHGASAQVLPAGR